MTWTVYVLVSDVAALTYVGITTDLARRVEQHNGNLRGGARSTRRARPWKAAAEFGPFATRGQATRVERAVKRLRGRERLEFVPEPFDPATPRVSLRRRPHARAAGAARESGSTHRRGRAS